MKKKSLYVRIISSKISLLSAAGLLALSLLSSCSQNEVMAEEAGANTKANIILNSYGAARAELNSLDAFLYLDGKFLMAYPNLLANDFNISFPFEYYKEKGAVLYFVANANAVQSGIDALLSAGGSFEEYGIDNLTFISGKSIALQTIPMGSCVKLSDISPAPTFDVRLTRTHSRVDFLIEEQGVEIDSIKMMNLSTGGRFADSAESTSDYYGELFDYVEQFSSPVTSSRTIGYINEQHNSNIAIQIYGKFNGLRIAFSTAMPSSILRNNIYTIRVVKVGTTLTASVIINDWGTGDNIDATPNLDKKILINKDKSVFPIHVKSSSTCDTLSIPSNRNSTILLALDAQYEVEASAPNSQSNFTITPAEGFNNFNLQFNGDLQGGAQSYYTYIILKNKFFEDEYGQRIIIKAQNFDIPACLNSDFSENGTSFMADGSLGISGVGRTNSDHITISKFVANPSYTIDNIRIVSLGTETLPALTYAAALNGSKIKVTNPTNYSGKVYNTGKAVAFSVWHNGNLVENVSIPIVIKPGTMAISSDVFVEMYGADWVKIPLQNTIEATVNSIIAINKRSEESFDQKLNAYRVTLGSSINTSNNPICGSQFGQDFVPPPGFALPSIEQVCALFGTTYNMTNIGSMNPPAYGSKAVGVEIEIGGLGSNRFATYKRYSQDISTNNAYYILFRDGATNNYLSLTLKSNQYGATKWTRMLLRETNSASTPEKNYHYFYTMLVASDSSGSWGGFEGSYTNYSNSSDVSVRLVKDKAANVIW